MTRALKTVDGVQSVTVDYQRKMAQISAGYPACSASSFDDMRAALRASGYDATVRSVR